MDRLESETGLIMNRCYFCEGTVKPEPVTHIHRWKGQMIILEDVPAEVCQQCGEVYFAPNVLQAMDQIAERKQKRNQKSSCLSPYTPFQNCKEDDGCSQSYQQRPKYTAQGGPKTLGHRARR